MICVDPRPLERGRSHHFPKTQMYQIYSVISSIRWLTLSILLFTSTFTMAQGVVLYRYVSEANSLPTSTTSDLQKLRGNKRLSEVSLIKIDDKALLSDWISLELPSGEIIQVNRRYDGPAIDSIKTNSWFGVIRKGSNLDDLILEVSDPVSGTLDYRGDRYIIRPLANGYHAIMQSLKVNLLKPDMGAVEPPKGSDSLKLRSSASPSLARQLGY